MNTISASRTASPVVGENESRPAAMFSSSACASPGSSDGGIPRGKSEIFPSAGWEPTPSCPMAAMASAVTRPTWPVRITATFIPAPSSLSSDLIGDPLARSCPRGRVPDLPAHSRPLSWLSGPRGPAWGRTHVDRALEVIERLDDTPLCRERHRREAAVDLELGKHVLDVCSSRLRTDDERTGDRLVVAPIREQSEDLALAPGQSRQKLKTLLLLLAPPHEVLDQRGEHSGGDLSLASMDRRRRLDEVSQRTVLREEPVGACLKRGQEKL